MKKFSISEKTLYSVLWICTIVAAGAVITLTVFAFGRRGDSSVTTPELTDVPKQTVQTSAPKGTTSTKPSVKPTAPDTSVDAPVLRFMSPVEMGDIAKPHDIETLSYSMTMNDYRTHRGVDIASEIGDAVFASADGVITGAYIDALMGRCIEITHTGGYKSIYRNLADELPEGIAEGCSVKAGQVIGAVGDSARIELADEPHLHFEMTLDGAPIDPAQLISVGE